MTLCGSRFRVDREPLAMWFLCLMAAMPKGSCRPARLPHCPLPVNPSTPMERDSSCDRLDKIVSNISNLRIFPLAFGNTVFCLLPSDVSPPTGIYQLMNHLLRLPQRTPAPLRGPLPLKGAQGYCAQRTANIVYLLLSIPLTISKSRARTSFSLPRFSSILSAAFR